MLKAGVQGQGIRVKCRMDASKASMTSKPRHGCWAQSPSLHKSLRSTKKPFREIHGLEIHGAVPEA